MATKKQHAHNGIKVEKGIPIPPDCTRGRKAKYPWHQLEVGDSFLTDSKHHHIRALADSIGMKYEMKFTVCKLPEGYRVWRTA